MITTIINSALIATSSPFSLHWDEVSLKQSKLRGVFLTKNDF